MPSDTDNPDLRQQIESHYPALLRVARHQLRNPDWASDAVSATVLAALERPPAFRDPSRVRGWLMGILRHKLVDEVRRHGHEQPLWCVGDASDIDTVPEAADTRTDPAERLQRLRLGQALVHAMDRVPHLQARAFELREWSGCDGDVICRELGIRPTHLRVLLHRARRGLQLQLRDWRP
jgi:RNA polymerase sigma factor (sigma-70 family)